MKNDILFISMFILVYLLITMICLYAIIFIFIGNYKYSYLILKDSLKLSLSRRSKIPNGIAGLLNNYAKKLVKCDLKLTDKELSNRLNMDIKETKQLKSKLKNKLSQQNTLNSNFIDISYVEKFDKPYAKYDFINLIVLFITFFNLLNQEKFLTQIKV